jgi:Ser-tRNA(Ala) deacylase AlaX
MTTLTYLTNPNILRQPSTITGKGADEKGSFITTDTTPAYAQGGGQEADNGLILCAAGEFRFNDVRCFDGIVRHYLQTGLEFLNEGLRIEIIVDENRRRKNSILHSAGHLVASVAFKNISGLTPIKGFHFNVGSYVELGGELILNAEEIKTQLQNILYEEIKTEKAVSYEMVTAEELKLKCPFIQPGLPPDKPLRVVNIESYFPMGCGGTHVLKLNEIPMLIITKIKSSKGVVRISYSCFNRG